MRGEVLLKGTRKKREKKRIDSGFRVDNGLADNGCILEKDNGEGGGLKIMGRGERGCVYIHR